MLMPAAQIAVISAVLPPVTPAALGANHHMSRLTFCAQPATWYRYDQAGKRLRKISFSAAGIPQNERIYFGNYEVYRSYDNTGTLTLERQAVIVPDGAKHLALVETSYDKTNPAAKPVTAIRYQFSNHLGSACLEVDDQAAVITYEEYFPYGATSFIAGQSAAEVSLKRYRYTGKERDTENGLHYHGARYYAAWLGRWTSCDPAGATDSNNLYLFVRANPVILSDKTGLIGEGPTINSVLTLPAKGQFGSVLPMSRQPKAWYDAAGNRLTENEHIMSRGATKAITTDPSTGLSDYTARDYHNDATVRVERNFALEKTSGNPMADNPRTARLKAQAAQGQPINYRDAWSEAIDNAKAARDQVGSAVTDEAIHRGALSQDANLFGLQRLSDSAQKVQNSGSVIEEFEIGEHIPVVTEEASKLGKVVGVAGKAIEVGGGILGAATGGWQTGTGIDEITQGKTKLGAVDLGEGTANLAMTIGVPALVKTGTIAAGAGAAAVTVATLAATASVGLAAETARAAIKGQETPIDVADKFYGTHFGDIYGWVTGAYSKH
jgi:RHS repeat-associated protein